MDILGNIFFSYLMWMANEPFQGVLATCAIVLTGTVVLRSL